MYKTVVYRLVNGGMDKKQQISEKGYITQQYLLTYNPTYTVHKHCTRRAAIACQQQIAVAVLVNRNLLPFDVSSVLHRRRRVFSNFDLPAS